MTRVWLLAIGVVATLSFAAVVLLVIPSLQMTTLKPSPELAPYQGAEKLGREVYIANGCVYCHTQQIRDPAFTADEARGWGRPTLPVDYVYDQPHLLGTMRTGPDLIHVGARLPSTQWHLVHMYQPQAVVPGSIMPPHPFLFRHKAAAESGDVVVPVPAKFAPAGKVVVATAEAQALAAYLVSLKRTYAPPVEPLPAGLSWCLP